MIKKDACQDLRGENMGNIVQIAKLADPAGITALNARRGPGALERGQRAGAELVYVDKGDASTVSADGGASCSASRGKRAT